MNVIRIVKDYLEKNGFDGLVSPGECGCVKEDLIPCGSDFSLCEPGYKGPCTCGEDCDWDIYKEKFMEED